MAFHHRAFIALTTFLALLAADGCKPVEDTRKIERPDAWVPQVDAGNLIERFCEGSAAGCSCFSNTCDRNCGPGECQDVTIICPAGQDCLITCDGEGACVGLVLECETGDADCALTCANGACDGARFRCNDAVGQNCCVCDSSSDAFHCPRGTGLDSCNPPAAP